ncbi:MAG: hypothetical protein M3R37_13360 [Actinomycetota bacterium]|nr:hypothetical protein [Actinomycetota bacterium]
MIQPGWTFQTHVVVVAAAMCAWALLPAPAAAAPVAKNLVATASVKAALRTTHLAVLQPSQRAGVRGPLKGTTYYGSVGKWKYALAMFSQPGVGTTDQPELFSKAPGGRWRDRGDTGGCLTKGIIPRALIRLWHLRSYC